MKSISVEVDEEFANALEAIEQPYLDRQLLIKTLLISGLQQYRIELAIRKYLEGGSKHMEGGGNSGYLSEKDEQDFAGERDRNALFGEISEG
jgi:hypothetical protein